MTRNTIWRVSALGLLIGLAGCVGHDDPVGVVKQPEEVDDADAREPAQPVFSPASEFPLSGV